MSKKWHILNHFFILFCFVSITYGQDDISKQIESEIKEQCSALSGMDNEWQLYETEPLQLCAPVGFNRISTKCFDSNCFKLKKDDVVINIDDGPAQYPINKSRLLNFEELSIERPFGVIWVWFYKQNGTYKNVAGARVIFTDKGRKVITLSLTSENTDLKGMAERIFQSIRISKTRGPQ